MHETNFFSDSGSTLLLIYRLIAFSIISWLVYEDIKMKHGLHYEKYTVWGEISTLVVLFLLCLCTLEKITKQLNKESGR
jgi:hypothetical protein